jgi:hypothetical protein
MIMFDCIHFTLKTFAKHKKDKVIKTMDCRMEHMDG